MARRTSVVAPPDEAVSLIKDGDVIGIGGFATTGKPMALVRELVRSGKRNLTVVASPASIDADLLISCGRVNKLVCAYVGAEAMSPLLPFHSNRCGRSFAMEEVDLGSLIYMLKARIMRLPFLISRGPVGTSLPQLNPNYRWIEDPFGGPPVIAVPALKIDVALLHAAQADRYGNVQHKGAVFLDPLIARAADKVIVQVEKLISNEEIKHSPAETSLPAGLVNSVSVVPYGAHPCASQNYYRADEMHFKEYVRAGKGYLTGEEAEFNNYLKKYITGVPDHAGYMEAVSFKRVMSLGLEEA